MSTPKDLMKSTWVRAKQLWTLNGDLEDYVLYATAKVGAFCAGVAVGYYLL
jgi:hypothetical protein